MEVTFESLGLSEAMLKALEEKGYGYPTTIQAEAIPYFLQWQDVIAKAPTGTGKTFAFGIPMIEHIDPASEGVAGADPGPHPGACHPDRRRAAGSADLFSGHPGSGAVRRRGHRRRRSSSWSSKPADRGGHAGTADGSLQPQEPSVWTRFKTVVLDEADRMLDMGFFKDVTRIIDKVKNRKNLGLFSATISQEVMTVSAGCTSGTRWRSPSEPKQEDRPDIDQFSITCTPLEKAETYSAPDPQSRAMSG